MYRVGEFEFETEAQARAAVKEAEGIKYLRDQYQMDDPDTVLLLYNRLISKAVFSTPVGYRFLQDLYDYLCSVPSVGLEDILPMPEWQVPGVSGAKEGGKERAGKAGQDDHADKGNPAGKTEKSYKGPFIVSTFFAVVFALALVGIFAIQALSVDNVTILNYENALIDKYEAWEEELTQREAALRELESQYE